MTACKACRDNETYSDDKTCDAKICDAKTCNAVETSMTIRRGEIYRFDLEPTRGSEQQGKARPCVVLSIDEYNGRLRTVGVVPLSSSPRPLPPLIVAVPSAGLATSTALCGQLRTLDKRRIVAGPSGRLSDDDLEDVERCVRQVYGL